MAGFPGASRSGVAIDASVLLPACRGAPGGVAFQACQQDAACLLVFGADEAQGEQEAAHRVLVIARCRRRGSDPGCLLGALAELCHKRDHRLACRLRRNRLTPRELDGLVIVELHGCGRDAQGLGDQWPFGR